MVNSIAIYIEGGGDTNSTKSLLREGFSEFLKSVRELARSKGIRWQLIICGGRSQTYASFVDAIEKEPETYNILLVDSEEPVTSSASPWTHLLNRQADRWHRQPNTGDAQCQMIVVCMESWFLVDPAGLKRHFGGNLDITKLPAADHAETRQKEAIADALRQAVLPTPAREYKKIRDGAALLKCINPDEVRKHCKWCQRLFTDLEAAIGSR